VGETFTIDVIASAPLGAVAAIDFDVIWVPEGNVEYVSVSAGNFLPNATAIEVATDVPGSQTVGVATASGANAVESGVLATLSFTKKTGEGSVKFGFANISALDLSLQQVANVVGIPSADITLPVAFSSLSAEVHEVGVILRWHTTHEMDNAGFDVLRSLSRNGDYVKLNKHLIEGQGTSAVPHDYQYIDSGVIAGNTYYYKVESLDLLGDKSSSKMIRLEVNEDALMPPERNELGQNYPNPGNPDTWIPYILSSDEEAEIEIYNMAGQLVRTLELGNRGAGKYISKDKAAHWDGRSSSGEEVPSGVYFYTIKAGEFVATRKLVMLE
jgi:hypothetical protein